MLERETLNQAEIADIFRDVRKRDFREIWLSKESRPVQTIPPVETRAERAEREAQEEAKKARLDEPLDTVAPHAQGVSSQETFHAPGPDGGNDSPLHG